MVYKGHLAHMSHIYDILEGEAVSAQLHAREHTSRAVYIRITDGISSPSSIRYNSRETAYWSKKARLALFQMIGDGSLEE